MRRLAAALALTLALASPALAETPSAVARALAAADGLKAAIGALKSAEGARDRVAALTQTIQAYEAGLAALREGLRGAAVREASLTRALDAKQDRISQLLGVLEGLERTPAPLLLLHPGGPVDAVRAAMVASDVTPALQAEAEALRRQLQEIADLRAFQEQSAAVLQQGLAAVQEARTTLSQAVSDRTDLPKRLTESPAELDRIATSVKSLTAFADILSDRETTPGDADAPPDFAAGKGTLPLPARGTLLRRSGEADAAGIRRPGLLIATRPRALVTAPCPATIRYLGPLLDYGNVIVLEPGEGYLLVLAGLGVVYGEVGQVIATGDPVGLMGGQEADPAEFVAAAQDGGGAEGAETLYLELRKGSTPVDPGPWFAETRE